MIVSYETHRNDGQLKSPFLEPALPIIKRLVRDDKHLKKELNKKIRLILKDEAVNFQ